MSISITAALIVKNEAKNLPECLNSVSWADEIIVLDSGSTDNTVAIAEKMGAKVYVNSDWKGFGYQRQLAQSYATSDWIFWIDADERVTEELKSSIITTINKSDNNIIYSVPRLSWVFGKFIRHCGWYPDPVMRLYPTNLTKYNDSLVHEKVQVNDGVSVKQLQGDLLHYTYDSLEHYLIKSAGYATAWADQRLDSGKKSSIAKGLLHAFGCFFRMYILKAGFLDGRHGLLLSILSAHSTFIKYADLWIKKQTRSD